MSLASYLKFKIQNWLREDEPTWKIKLTHPEATLPEYSRDGDACMDVTSVENVQIKPFQCVAIDTGIKFQDVSNSWKICVWSRSGTPIKQNLIVGNSVGTADENFRGNLKVILINVSNEDQFVTVGQKIAQVSMERVNPFKLELSDEETETERGANGFGSSGSHR